MNSEQAIVIDVVVARMLHDAEVQLIRENMPQCSGWNGGDCMGTYRPQLDGSWRCKACGHVADPAEEGALDAAARRLAMIGVRP